MDYSNWMSDWMKAATASIETSMSMWKTFTDQGQRFMNNYVEQTGSFPKEAQKAWTSWMDEVQKGQEYFTKTWMENLNRCCETMRNACSDSKSSKSTK